MDSNNKNDNLLELKKPQNSWEQEELERKREALTDPKTGYKVVSKNPPDRALKPYYEKMKKIASTMLSSIPSQGMTERFLKEETLRSNLTGNEKQATNKEASQQTALENKFKPEQARNINLPELNAEIEKLKQKQELMSNMWKRQGLCTNCGGYFVHDKWESNNNRTWEREILKCNNCGRTKGGDINYC